MNDETAELRATVHQLQITVAQFAVTVDAFGTNLASIQSTLVTRDAHEALAREVKRVEEDADEGISRIAKFADEGIRRNDERWSRLAWFVGLAILAAGIGVLINSGGVVPT